MRLSDFFSEKCIFRDAEFDALGLSNTDLKKRLLSFLEDNRFACELNANENICAVICTREAVSSLDKHIKGIIISDTPRKDYFELHNRLSQSIEYCPPQEPTKIGENCQISPLAVIDAAGIVIGNNVTVEEFAVIHGPCEIGDNTIIRTGAKIGGQGFEFKRFAGSVLDVVHCGKVIIGKNVIIWENTTIHKAVYPWDSTHIGNYARISANAHIDHGAKISDFAEICAGAIVSGRTSVGNRALVGPGAVLSNRITVGDCAKVSLGSVVTKDVPENQAVSGNFAVNHEKFLSFIKSIR